MHSIQRHERCLAHVHVLEMHKHVPTFFRFLFLPFKTFIQISCNWNFSNPMVLSRWHWMCVANWPPTASSMARVLQSFICYRFGVILYDTGRDHFPHTRLTLGAEQREQQRRQSVRRRIWVTVTMLLLVWLIPYLWSTPSICFTGTFEVYQVSKCGSMLSTTRSIRKFGFALSLCTDVWLLS